MVPSVVTSAAVWRSPMRPWSAMGGYRSMAVPLKLVGLLAPRRGQRTSRSTRLAPSRRVNAAKISLTPKKTAHTPTSVTSVKSDRCHDRTAHTPNTSSAAPSSNCAHHHSTFGPASALTRCMTPNTIRYQATKIATTYRVISGHTKVMTPAATPKTPATTHRQRQLCTRPATARWVTPPNRKLSPTNAATAYRLPTRYDSTNMPNRVHTTPRIKNHHHTADRSRTPARTVSRSVPEGVASLVMAGPLAPRRRLRFSHHSVSRGGWPVASCAVLRHASRSGTHG